MLFLSIWQLTIQNRHAKIHIYCFPEESSRSNCNFTALQCTKKTSARAFCPSAAPAGWCRVTLLVQPCCSQSWLLVAEEHMLWQTQQGQALELQQNFANGFTALLDISRSWAAFTTPPSTVLPPHPEQSAAKMGFEMWTYWPSHCLEFIHWHLSACMKMHIPAKHTADVHVWSLTVPQEGRGSLHRVMHLDQI